MSGCVTQLPDDYIRYVNKKQALFPLFFGKRKKGGFYFVGFSNCEKTGGDLFCLCEEFRRIDGGVILVNGKVQM